MITDLKSYEAHNSEYEKYSYEFCINQQQEWKNKRFEYEADKPIGHILDNYSNINLGVDIGCGQGYFTSVMANKLKKVYAIEPSKAALQMAEKIHINYSNIIWIEGFAEQILHSLELNEPAIFHTGCVLSHLEDDVVIEICRQVNKIAPSGSVLSFSEIYGDESHENLWHCRTKYWWQKNLINWDLNFINFPVQIQGRFKAFYGTKI